MAARDKHKKLCGGVRRRTASKTRATVASLTKTRSGVGSVRPKKIPPKLDSKSQLRGRGDLRYIDNLSEERRLDGTAGQHQIRENGRFGSASPHDRFDDDSAP